MSDQQGIEERQVINGVIHDGQCKGHECGGIFVCPSCGKLCGWCFGGAPDPRCDACVVDSPEKEAEYRCSEDVSIAREQRLSEMEEVMKNAVTYCVKSSDKPTVTREGIAKMFRVCFQVALEDELTGPEAEAELRSEGVDVDGFVERLFLRIRQARLVRLARTFFDG